MATFAKGTFDVAKYALSRPTYPRALFDAVFTYHEQSTKLPGCDSHWERAVDLGCGTGQATSELLMPVEDSEDQNCFEEVYGVDPSPKMIEQATAYAAKFGERGAAMKFVEGPAEDLSFLEDGDTDMVIAAQAAHWFNWKKLWPELERVLAPGGTAAFWVYSEFRLPQYPQLTPLITQYAQGKDRQTSLGPHWEPGRAILANHLLDIQVPEEGWDDVSRVFFTGDYYPDLPQPHLAPIMRKTMTWGGAGLHGYLRTFSALHRFHEEFPEDLEHSEGDIATRFLRNLMTVAEVPLGPEGLEQEVEVEWPLALVIARRELDYEDPYRERQLDLHDRLSELKTEYDTASEEAGDPKTVEETQAKLNKWIDTQEQVLAIIDEDIADAAQYEDLEDKDDIEDAFRYVEHVNETRMTASWALNFKKSFDTALELAVITERQVGREDIPAAMQRWTELMNEKMDATSPPLVVAFDNPDAEDVAKKDATNTDAEPSKPKGLTDEDIANLTPVQMAAFEKREALQSILRIAEELARDVPEEPISDLIAEMYISASREVSREIVIV
ncbi:hypothetical protein C8R43DRAFT_1126022 [Mycena crocata]|nr:hypothetical protein C8R43DRAFT_1126022 [Mycena crocata]